MKNFKLTYHHFSERSILVQWPQHIEENILDDVLAYKNHLLNNYIKSILHINNSYSSMLIVYKSTIDNINTELLALKASYLSRERIIKSIFNHWKIPVCYDDDFGIDLNFISKENNISKSKIIELHSTRIYTVYFIGFLPGFLYLGGLDNHLHFPRKKQPRLRIEKGAVAIGNNQTGIYPNSSPAGWNVIGNSPLNFFDVTLDEPCFASSGDKIQFEPISRDRYQNIKKQVDSGDYVIEREMIYD